MLATKPASLSFETARSASAWSGKEATFTIHFGGVCSASGGAMSVDGATSVPGLVSDSVCSGIFAISVEVAGSGSTAGGAGIAGSRRTVRKASVGASFGGVDKASVEGSCSGVGFGAVCAAVATTSGAAMAIGGAIMLPLVKVRAR